MYCPETGEALAEHPLPAKYWSRLLYSSRHAYLLVLDDRWEPSPLLRLQPGVFDKLREATPELLDVAFGRIRRIDYRTVSIMVFEHTLLGCYDPKASYRIVWPDGSER